jgi:hypothetical protein
MKWVWVCGALVACSVAASGQILQNVGFESPYTLGNLVGQQSWVGDTTAGTAYTVVSGGYNSSHAAFFDTNLATGNNWAWRPLNQSAVGGVFIITARVRFTPFTGSNPFNQFSAAGLDIYGQNSSTDTASFGRICTFTIGATGTVRFYSGDPTTVFPGVTALPNTWHRLQIILDNVTNPRNARGTFDGVPTPNQITGIRQFVSDVDLYAVATGFDTFRFDDVKVESLPIGGQTYEGRVFFQGYPVPTAASSLQILVFNPSNVLVSTINTTCDAEGYYRFQTSLSGAFKIVVRAPQRLFKSLGNFTVNPTTPFFTVPTVTLFNGDIDGDDVISILDYIDLSTRYDTQVGDALYSNEADLDDDGFVSILDYLILSQNYELLGDRPV